jgi:Protein of unknown function (DUF3489)
MKLSDTQLMILSSASQRTDHAAVLPANLKGSAANKVVNKLLNEKLLQELRAKDDMPVWRRGDDSRPYSLRITKAGLKAIEVEDVSEASDNNAAADPDEIAAADVSTQAKSSERPSRAKRSGAKKTAAVSPRAVKASSDRVEPDTKQDKIVALLRRPEGANLDVLVKETGWQKHSVRGFLAGTVRKKLKLPLLSEKIDGVRNYRIGTAKSARTTRTAAARKA